MKLKKLLAFVLCAFLTAGVLVGCGSTDEGGKSDIGNTEIDDNQQLPQEKKK